jgi:hypothetical protein
MPSRHLTDLAVRFGRRSRDEKWHRYCAMFPPRRGERVLDVGVNARAIESLPLSNFFLRQYPYLDQLTGLGISDMSGLDELYPGATFVRGDGRRMPFEDQTFDVVHSNAVVEHVGPSPDQERFIAECVRVGRAGFITTPNRWFPIEPHLREPFIHWMPRDGLLWLLRKRGRLGPDEEWRTWLLSGRAFRRLFPSEVETRFAAQRMAGIPATFIVAFRHRDGVPAAGTG